MKIILVGAGSVGRHLCEILVNEGHDVTVIEKEERKCELLLSRVDVEIIKADATDPEILEEAKIGKCDIIITTSKLDEVNFIACMYAKNSGVKRIISRVNKSQYDKMLRNLGIETIRPDISTAREIDLKIIRPCVAKLVLPGVGNVEILEVVIAKNSPFVGKRISSIPLKEDCEPIVLHRKDEFVLNSRNFALEEGDVLILMCRPRAIKDTLKLFRVQNGFTKMFGGL